jgi:hypothetical protein
VRTPLAYNSRSCMGFVHTGSPAGQCSSTMQTTSPDRILEHHARFSGPIFPGETIVVRLWKDGEIVSFEARSKERGVPVITNGFTTSQ